MKMNFIKPLTIAALVSMGMFSCAGTDDAQTNSGAQNTETTTTVGAETGTTGTVGTETDTQMGSETDTQVGTQTDTQMGTQTDQGLETTQTERVSNEDVQYAEMFEGVETEQYDVLSLIRMEPNLSTFVELLEMSGLEASLQVEMVEPVTIFAPSNQAFNEMDQGEYQRLTDPTNRTELVEFIQYHILPRKVYETQFNTTQVIETNGENNIPVDTRMNGEVIFVGGAEIMKSDIEASNGVIHVVDGVVRPTEFAEPRR